MTDLLLLVSTLAASTPARAADDPQFERLTERSERLAARTAAAQQRWSEATADADEGPRAHRRAARAESHLIGARYREGNVQRVLAAWDEPARDVIVFYATNRRHDDRKGYVARDADRMEFGEARVHIPRRHPLGAVDRDLKVVAVEPMTEEGFLAKLTGAVAAAGPQAEILTYVHGYNNSFDYAARRSAQIANDVNDAPGVDGVGLEVVPVLFAWPSHGGEWLSSAKYTYDENAAARSSSLFADFLESLTSGTGATPVNVLAHSMGSRVVTDALVDLDRRNALHDPLDELVFAAPDMDAAVFGRRYLDLSLQAAERVTVYCADDDRALKLSRGVHGGYDRLGNCRDDTITALTRPGLEFVDASSIYVDIIDHDKVADSPRLLTDLGAVLRGVPADSPGRELVERGEAFELPP